MSTTGAKAAAKPPSTATSRFELAAEVRLSPISPEAEANLAAMLRTFSVTRLGSVNPESRGYAGHAVIGVLAHQTRLSAGRLAWTLIEVRSAINKAESCACAVVPSELAAAASVGQVVCLLSPAVSLSTSRTSLVLRVGKPAQVLVIGRARDCGKCAQCGTAVNLRYGKLCAAHQASSAVRIKCDRLDVASQAPRCQIVGLPIKQYRQLSTGVFRLDGAQLAVDKHGRAKLEAPDGDGENDEEVAARIARARDEASERALLARFPPQPKKSIGARYVQLVKQATDEELATATRKPGAAAPAPHARARPASDVRPLGAANPHPRPQGGGAQQSGQQPSSHSHGMAATGVAGAVEAACLAALLAAGGAAASATASAAGP